MRIPSVFFGTLKEVKANCRKINTRLSAGDKLEDCISEFPEIDSSNFPNAFFWLDKAWSMAGGSQHFIFCEFSYSLDSDKRLNHEQRNKIYNDCLDWLSCSAWGTLVLNGTQNYSWVMNLPWTLGPRVRGEYAVIKGFRDNYEELSRQGPCYFSGGNSGSSLGSVFLQVIRIIAGLSEEREQDIRSFITPGRQILYGKIHEIIVQHRIVENYFELRGTHDFA